MNKKHLLKVFGIILIIFIVLVIIFTLYYKKDNYTYVDNGMLVVSGYWDLKGKSRKSYSHKDYMKNIGKKVQFNADYAFFGNKDTVSKVKKFRKNKTTHVYIMEVDDLFKLAEDIFKYQNILQRLDETSMHKDDKDGKIHCPSPELLLIWLSKIVLLKKSMELHPAYTHYGWIDSCYKAVSGIPSQRPWPAENLTNVKGFFIKRTNGAGHDKYWKMGIKNNNAPIGGMWCGDKESCNLFVKNCIDIIKERLKKGYTLCTEQDVFNIAVSSLPILHEIENKNNDYGPFWIEDHKLTISLCIPCIPKHLPYLKYLLHTLKNQTVLPKEIIISLSDTDTNFYLIILKQLKISLDMENIPISLLISKEKKYAGENRQIAFDNVSGDIAVFIDADDVMHNQRLEIIQKAAMKYNSHVIIHEYSRTSKDLTKKYNDNDISNSTFGDKIWKANAKYGKITYPKDHLHLYGYSPHHGHMSVRSYVPVKHKNVPRGQDAIFLRDILNYYGPTKETVLLLHLKLTLYNEHFSSTKNNFNDITTIITSAPQKSIPSTHIIMKTIKSLELIPILKNSHVIIGFDGNNVINPEKIDPKCRTAFSEKLYNEYKNNVKTEAHKILPNVDFVEMSQRSCLSNLLKECMNNVTTKFVNVMQQDIPFIKSFDLNVIIQLLNENPKVSKVRLSTRTNKLHENFTKKMCKDVLSSEEITFMGNKFTTCSQWSDQNHITTVKYYNDYVWPNVKKGSFMEHDLFCNPVKNNDRSVWYLGDINASYSEHTDGRNSE